MDIHFPKMGYTHQPFELPGSDIKKSGYLRKLKTMKKKFFILRSTSSSGAARLEYHGSEKKFQAGVSPKRSILLHTCFNINRKSDSRSGRWGIVLYTVQDSFIVLAESEEEQESWLAVMLEYQNEYLPDGDIHREHYEHVWQVIMQSRGLGQIKGNKGTYRMCLNRSTVNFFKVNTTKPQFSIQLVTIRVVGHNENTFWLTVGHYASTGPGELYFTVENIDAAKDIHTTILEYMSSVQDVFHKDQQFSHVYPRDNHTSLFDGFGLSLQAHDSRKFYPIRVRYQEDGSLDFTRDFIVNHRDVQNDLTPPLCPSDLDGEVSSYTDFQKPDFASMISHQGQHSSHPSSMHVHNFSDLQFLTHLPTVKEGGSGEGYLLSDIPSSSTCSSEHPRPEPAACLLYDDCTDLPPRTYSLGSRPVKKFQGYSEMGPRREANNEMSRATSAPHILKGRREREHAGEPTPAISPLSMSLKSDDSDSFADLMPIRPRTASDSLNCRPRASSFSKLQQNCRPRSSSYGLGKRPVININKLRLEKAMMSQDPLQRTSRESSLLGSFESLRVSRESLRRTSQELRQPGGSYTDETDMRSTPSPQMRNTSDLDEYIDLHLGPGKQNTSPQCTRTDSVSSGRSLVPMTRSEHQRQQPHPQHINEYVNMAPSSGGGDSSGGQPYVNMDYGTNVSDNRPVTIASHIQSSSHQESTARYRNVDSGCKNKRSAASRSVSMENVDTYFISDFHLSGKPRTNSCGSKDKNTLRPESTRKSSTASVSSSSTSSSSGSTHPWPHPSVISSGVTHQPHSQVSVSGVTYQQQPSPLSSLGATYHQPYPLVPSSGIPHPHPLVSSSTRTFGSSDSIRKASSKEKTVAPEKNFRKKSGSIGSRPTSKKVSLTSGKEPIVSSSGIMPLKKLSSTRFSEEEPTYQFVKYTSATTRRDSHNSYGQSSFPNSGLTHFSQPMTYPGQSGSFSSSEGVTTVHSNSVSSPSEKDCYIMYNPTASSSVVSPHINHQQHQHGHSHHQPPHLGQPATSSSTSSSSLPPQTKQMPTKDGLDCASFGLGKASHSAPPRVVHYQRLPKTKDEQMRFKHGISPATTVMQSSGRELVSSEDPDAYVDYQPSNDSFPSAESFVPGSAASHIHSSRVSDTVGKPKLKHQHISLETATSVNKCHKPGLGSLLASRTITYDSANQSESNLLVDQQSLPPVPPLPTPAVTPQRSPSSSNKDVQEECGSFHYCLEASAVKCSSQDDASLDLGESNNMAATCLNLPLSQEINPTSAEPVNADVQNSCLHQSRQQQSHSFQRQLSAPVHSTDPTNHPQLEQHLVQSARTQSTDRTCNSCSLPVSDIKSSAGSCTKHPHLARISNTLQKSFCRVSPDSEGTSCKGNSLGSDISACSADIINKSKLSGWDSSALATAERHVFPQSKSMFSCGETTLSNVNSSESKIIPTKSRTRRSLGDIMGVVGIERWKRQGNRTSSDVVSSSNPSCRDSLQLAMGPRSRHSLSDLGSCQHMLSASLDNEFSTAHGNRRAVGDNSGDLCGRTNRGQFPKPSNRS